MKIITTRITEHSNWSAVEDVIKTIDKHGIFVSFCDNYFTQNTKPMRESWCGVIHNPFDWEKYTPWDNKTPLVNIRPFVASLKFCKMLFVMNDTQVPILNKWLLSNGFDYVKVHSLVHPINNLSYEFNYDKYILNNDKTIFSIGNWLRKQYTIFKLKCNSKFKKAILPFTERTRLELKHYTNLDGIQLTTNEINSVIKMEHLNTNDYHKIFESNLVLLDVYLTTINNTFLECVITNTPIILNRKQEYINLIGESYPLYFDDIATINELIENDEHILKAHQYLKNIDKTKFSMAFFKQTLEQHLD